ncbi:glycoside hydrolase family 2 protein [Puniceicoccales bacterium CK1056]|uniref:Glycoside hydrolase family 2 protein n=1 Tax=Oceanipulchritudo coccoides TaxID=2706888 RepID=A0A6B2M1F9_9BACT|nr:glycoside hydrolase family 2 TIM barrel-domain containing protein [Oceanipulchritudo coccoides]NDV61570.1 glycoside hydrolase family 2 protein [Oceanipulchritudo coccoides]
MNLSYSIFLLAIAFSVCACHGDTDRERTSFNADWQMMKGDFTVQTIGEAGEQLWEPVRLPHDWAISQRPVKGASMKNYGHYPLPGTYWYRKSFVLPEEDQDKLISLYFEGIMRDATIYLNGEQVGRWVYGYTSFPVNLLPYLKFGEGEVNELLVRLHLTKKFTRWYTGAGIYRDVWMIKTNPTHFVHDGVFITTPTVQNDYAIVNVETEISSAASFSGKGLVEAFILNSQDEVVAQGKRVADFRAGETISVEQELKVLKPNLWDIENPYLYKLVTKLKIDEMRVDELETNFGIRTFRFDANEGFFLNGRHVKIYGVNNHHDLGPLGTAFNLRAAERQLEILREMGCNAIRTSHNPSAPGLLDLCDRMGFLVMNELFDSWTIPKGVHDEGYTPKHWDDWWEKDLKTFVRRDRNHPSIIMWSSGNEIPEQRHEKLAQLSREITDEFHKYDPTRPVTAGFNLNKDAVENGFVDTVDVVGWNYATKFGDWYNDFRARPEFKDKPQIATETVSTQSSRGYYRFPYGEPNLNGPENQACSYVMRAPHYGLPPDMELMRQATSPSLAGEFIWTGFDYIGEPWPYEEDSTLSYYGLIDLCGFPKDIFYNYQSAWRPNYDMVHILPHWTWPGREGKLTPIHVFTNGDEAELFVNGKSHGKRRKGEGNTMVKSFSRHDAGSLAKFTNRMIWEDVIYEPGEVKVVAWKNGEKIAENAIHTAGEVARLQLTADRKKIRADYEDLSFITVDAVDDAGRFVPTFNGTLEFSVEGEGELVALGSGNPTDFTPMQGGSTYRAFNGKCLAIVRGIDGKPGSITVRVKGVPARITAEDVYSSVEVTGRKKTAPHSTQFESGEIIVTTEL